MLAWLFKRRPRPSGAGEPIELTLYTRAGCALCDEMKAEIEGARLGGPFVLREVDIAKEAELERRYGERIPVLELEGQVLEGRLRPGELARAFDRAARERGRTSSQGEG